MRRKYKYYLSILVLFGSVVLMFSSKAKLIYPQFDLTLLDLVDSPDNEKPVKLKYPLEDRSVDEPTDEVTTDEENKVDLNDPKNIKTDIEYDPKLGIYNINEKIGNQNYRNPNYMTAEEFVDYQARQDEDKYWKKRSATKGIVTKSGAVIPKVNLGNALFDRLFGGSDIELKPQGNVDLSFGGNWQNIQNPALLQSQRKYGIFDFDPQMNLSMLAKVGEKMRMNFNFNSQSTFEFENPIKLDYAGEDDVVLRKLEAGNISFPLKTQLITGVQSLLGVKAQLQFGRLTTTTVLSQQKSQKESITLKGGAQTQNFSVSSDQYDINRHFLLAQMFRDNYNRALSKFPIIQSQANITRIEVWLTNRNGTNENTRDVLALMDLGEPRPYNNSFFTGNVPTASNGSNNLYSSLLKTPGIREVGSVVTAAKSIGLKGTQDFEKTYARKLNPNEFSFNPQLGFISINTFLNPDDVLGVAYQYTYNGKVFQVGEFSQDIPPDSSNTKVLMLKMLKSTTFNPHLPIWDLMMKNVYSLGAGGLAKQDFKLNVMYQDASGAKKRYLPEGPNSNLPLITVLHLDRLNNQNDPQPDGVFDFVEGTTINAQQGKIIFPVLEPFGEDLRYAFGGNPQLEKKYLYTYLYDSTQFIAQQFPQLNRFLIEGTYRSNSSSEIYLGGYNIPQGSVVVTQGGAQLIENVDYQIDYNLGRVKILNTGALNSGIPINVQYENNASFGVQVQNLIGNRFDYFVNNKFNFGGTILRKSERPFNNKVLFGEDPIKNTMLGIDANYQSELPWLTRALDRLPIYSTTTPSIINSSMEAAVLIPRTNKVVDNPDGNVGTVYIDDFEGARSSYDLKFPITSWALASIPSDAPDASGNIMFPEAAENNSINSGKNRAKFLWYSLDPTLIDPSQGSMPEHLKKDKEQLSNHYLRVIGQNEVFPQRSLTALNSNIFTMDLAFYPYLRGPYNYDVDNVDATTGKLLDPTKRWGGIMRYIDFSDFEASNVEFIELWMLDPFLHNTASSGGKMYIQMGNISEDILKDSRKSFENGIPYPYDANKMDKTNLGQVPKFQQQINQAFNNEDAARERQDVGYDAMNDAEERDLHAKFLSDVSTKFGPGSTVYRELYDDPANDNYHFTKGEDYDQKQLSIYDRYKKFNNPQGNSPVSLNSATFSPSYTNIPESEDLNRDNTLNENEQYYQYEIDLKPGMQVGDKYIINRQVTQINMPNGTSSSAVWYQIRIPIREFQAKVGNINDFRSIRFMRLFLNGFEDSAYIRLARFELGRNQWRRYNASLRNPGELIPGVDNSNTLFNVTSVSLEENQNRTPYPYVMPPGIVRQQTPGVGAQLVQQNEQSMSLQVCNLEDGNAKGVFKSVGLDFRQYKRIKMFIHAESYDSRPSADEDLRAFIRLGNDFTSNYYEYQIPLQYTKNVGTRNPLEIWPERNNLDLALAEFIAIKSQRNAQNWPINVPYFVKDSKGNYIGLIGNPSLSEVKNAMLGIMNPKRTPADPRDDGGEKCAEIWFNELRLAETDNDGGYAALGKMDISLADLGTVKLSGNMHTQGFGQIDQKVNERFRDDFYQYSAATNINAGKLFPKEWGVQLPVYAGYSQSISNPQYNPYDMDVNQADKLASMGSSAAADSLRKMSQDVIAITGFNMNNVRIQPTPKKGSSKKVKAPWAISNFDFSYNYTKTNKRNPLLAFDNLTEQTANAGYSYAPTVKSFEPFKKLVPKKGKYWSLIRDVNISPLPNNVTLRTDLNRTFGKTQIRNIDEPSFQLPTTYYKFFTWNRTYNMSWKLTKSIGINYAANANARVDEPFGEINTAAKRDTVRQNFVKGGRTTMFNQSINATYEVPISKIPILDFVTLNTTYSATYNYNAASLLASYLGNTMANTQSKTINSTYNFTQLYNKNKWLKKANTPKPQTFSNTSNNKDTKKDDAKSSGRGNEKSKPESNSKALVSESKKDDLSAKGKGDSKSADKKDDKSKKNDTKPKSSNTVKKDPLQIKLDAIKDSLATNPTEKARLDLERRKRELEEKQKQDALLAKKKAADAKKKAKEERKKKQIMSEPVRIGLRTLTMLKRASINYSENSATTLPGFVDNPQYVGVNWRSSNPQVPFAFGAQNEARTWLNDLGNSGLLSKDSLFNTNFQQTFSQNLTVTATVEPLPDCRIDFTLNKNFNKAYNELYKDTTGSSGFSHLNPFETGGLSISFNGIRTIFQKQDDAKFTQAFYDFEANRKIISQRLGIINPYVNGLSNPTDPEYSKGYNRYAQEVLIPAFLAAYTGKDANTYPLVTNEPNKIRNNPFKWIMPQPNWRLTYNGLAKWKVLKPYFTNITVSHGYNSTLSMNSFNSSLFYYDPLGIGYPAFIDSNTGNFVPYFNVPNITLNETFGPLAKVDLTFKNSMNLSVEYKKSRTMSLSLVDYQLSETKSKEITVGGGWRLKKVRLPIPYFNINNMKNDMNIKLDFSLRDDQTGIMRLDQRINQITRGQKVVRISPSIDYIYSPSLTVRLFYDRTSTVPYTTNSFPISNTRGGVMLRFLLGN